MFFKKIMFLPSLAAFLLVAVSDSPAAGAGLYQEAFIKASNPNNSDWFGFSAAISGDTLVVGAPLEDSNASGVNGNSKDDSESNAGAAYVFARTSSGWRYEAYLKASTAQRGARFGNAVAIDGDTIVVGAPSGGADSAGAVYAFSRAGATWSFQRTLRASNAELFDGFGTSVAVAGGIVAVGAPGEDGVNNGSGGSGAVYLFDGGFETALLRGSNTDEGDAFGFTVAFSGNLLAVGAPNQAGSGAVYVFGGGGRSEEAFLKASNPDMGDRFGETLSISGERLVAGAFHEFSHATGVNGDGNDNSLRNSGAAYIFAKSGGAWGQEAYLKASNPDFFDEFGGSVAISGDTVVVGARNEGSNAVGVNGDQGNSSSGSDSGAAYVFQRVGQRWFQTAYLKASNTGAADLFGSSITMSGGTVVAGAIGDDSNSKLIDGNQGDMDPATSDSGAVYVFTGLFDR